MIPSTSSRLRDINSGANDLSSRKDEMGEAVQTRTGRPIMVLMRLQRSLNRRNPWQTQLFPPIPPRRRRIWEVSSTRFWIRLTPLRRIPGTRGINLLNGTDVSLSVKFDEKGRFQHQPDGFQWYVRAGRWRPRNFGCHNGSIDRGRG